MGLLERLLRRVENPTPTPVRTEDGFVHAPDASPDETIVPSREERPLFGGLPHGWRRVVGQGTALPPGNSEAATGGDGGDGGS